MLLNIWVALIVMTLAGLGGFTLARNRKSPINRSFAMFATVTAIWVTVNYIGANFKEHQFASLFIYADLALGAWLGYVFWSFTRNLLAQARETRRKFKVDAFFIVFTGFFSLIAMSSLVINPHMQGGTTVLEYGQFYDVYSAAILLLVVAGVWNMIAAKRIARGLLHAQIVIILWAGLTLVIPQVIANFITPQITD